MQEAQNSNWINRGALKIDLNGQKAIVQGPQGETDLSLTPIEFRILVFLANNEGKFLTGKQVLSAVWGEGVTVALNSVYFHIHSLRRKLGSNNFIQSSRQSGYRFSSAATAA